MSLVSYFGMPQRIATRGGSTRKSRSAGTSRDDVKDDSSLSRDASESDPLQDLSLKLNSEAIKSVTVGDEEFEMLMLDGCSHLICPFYHCFNRLEFSVKISFRFLPIWYFFISEKCCGAGLGLKGGLCGPLISST
jgi:hypothetical protein